VRTGALDHNRHNWQQNLKVDGDANGERRKLEKRARDGGADSRKDRLNDQSIIWRIP
jgi:hypothetical protein